MVILVTGINKLKSVPKEAPLKIVLSMSSHEKTKKEPPVIFALETRPTENVDGPISRHTGGEDGGTSVVDTVVNGTCGCRSLGTRC